MKKYKVWVHIELISDYGTAEEDYKEADEPMDVALCDSLKEAKEVQESITAIEW